ncbi:MAG TPA: hypothetical protein VFZ61_03845 [Polyangiales bacterium]
MAAQLSWTAVTYEASALRGAYTMERIENAWELYFHPVNARRERGRRVPINCADDQGACDWPTLECAKLAAKQHQERMAAGDSADVAAAWVQALCTRKAG